MKRILPPILVLLVVAVVVVRALGRPARAEMQGRIRGLWTTPSDRPACLDATGDYLESFSEPQDLWFAAEAYLRIGAAEQSLALIFGEDGSAPGDAPRYGDIGLRVMGWTDATRTQPTQHGPEALVAFGQAGEAWALEELERIARHESMSRATAHWFPALKYLWNPALAAVCRGLRAHVTIGADYQLHARIAAGIAELGTEGSPDDAGDEAALRAFLPRGRGGSRDAWGASAVALGRTATKAGMAALEKEESRLLNAKEPENLALIRCGYVSAGRWEHASAIRTQLERGAADNILVESFAQAVIWRVLQGDPEAGPALGEMWSSFPSHQPSPRRSIAFALLLGPRGPKELGALPIEQMLRDLDNEQGVHLLPTLGAIFRLRRGDPDGLARLVISLRSASASAALDASIMPEAQQSWLAGLRGMLLYGAR